MSNLFQNQCHCLYLKVDSENFTSETKRSKERSASLRIFPCIDALNPK